MVCARAIKTEGSALEGLSSGNKGESSYPVVWALGNLNLLRTPLLGFFCSVRCPGTVILRVYDLIRALRNAGVPVIGGFQSPMERECLDLLLRGEQSVVVCPARSIERIRVPGTWHNPLADGRLLVLSPFEAKHRRPTVALSNRRNRLVGALAREIVVGHATEGGKIAALCAEWVGQGRRIHTLDLPENAHLVNWGVIGRAVEEVVGFLS